jgi:hypothetical protein
LARLSQELCLTAYLDPPSLMLGGPVATPAWHSIAWSIAITAVFAPLAVRRCRHIG